MAWLRGWNVQLEGRIVRFDGQVLRFPRADHQETTAEVRCGGALRCLEVRMNLFLDSNIWLALYDSPRKDLEELGKLVGLVEKGRVALLLPDQVVNEVRRNRDKKIANDIQELRNEILLEEVP